MENPETTTPIERPSASSSSASSSTTTTTAGVDDNKENSKPERPAKNGKEEADSSSSGKASGKSKEKDSDSDTNEDAKTFECNICLDVAKDAVVSHCGHLFCWPCLHQWLETRPNRQSCPVCKAAISREKVIPLYGRGGQGTDPRSKVPPRPTPPRQENAESNRFTWGGQDGGGAASFHLSFGIGAFPFGFLASAFNWAQPGQAGVNINTPIDDQEFLSKIFLWVALIFIVWLLLA